MDRDDSNSGVVRNTPIRSDYSREETLYRTYDIGETFPSLNSYAIIPIDVSSVKELRQTIYSLEKGSDSGVNNKGKDEDLSSIESSYNDPSNTESLYEQDDYENEEKEYEEILIDTDRREKRLEAVHHIDQTTIAIQEVAGDSILDLRKLHRRRQKERAQERYDYESDSDSEADISDTIRHIAEEDTTWFRGCGFQLTLGTALLFTQLGVGLLVIIFCIIKLLSTNDCDVMSTYAPLLAAIVTYFLPSPLTRENRNHRDKEH